MKVIKYITAIAVLVLGIYIALSPHMVFAPTPQVVLYCLISFLPAMFFGAEAQSKFELKLRGFCFTTIGASAVCLGTLLLLTYLSKPKEENVGIFHILEEDGDLFNLIEQNVEKPVTDRGTEIPTYIDGSTIIVVFPVEVHHAELGVRKVSDGPWYRGTVWHNKQPRLRFGKDLKISE